MYKCPHCGKPGISVWRKLCLGPLIPAICKQCGNEVWVPYSSAMFVMIPVIIATVLTVIYIDSIMLKIAICVVVAIIGSVIYLKYVPLVPKYK